MRITRDLVVGGTLGVLAIVYWALSYQIEQAGVSLVGPEFVPRVIAGLMLLLSALLAWRGWREGAQPAEPGKPAGPAADGSDEAPPNYVPVLLTAALLAVYINVMDPLGFMPSTAAYLWLQFNISAPKDKRGARSQIGSALLALAVAIAVNYAFVEGFNVMLPQGILD